MNKIIVPVGYMGSGSSAITHLMSEYKGYDAKHGEFEYVFLHCPNGVFDLEDKLLVGNNALRSDEALHTFLKEMTKLYQKKYYWVGHYKEIVGEAFLDDVKDYIDTLIDYRSDYYWYVQEDTSKKMVIQLIFKRIVETLSFHKIKLPKPLLYPQAWLSYPTPEKFYQASHDFIYKTLNHIGLKDRNIILDQLLLPHNLHRIDHYFDDDLHCFVISRDPRDVFIINKYIWAYTNEVVPYEKDVHRFCQQYRLIRSLEKTTSSNKVHRFQFEDFIYNYEHTVSDVESILGLTPNDHINPKKAFNPDISINNTQLFRLEKYKEEVSVIEQELKDYLYDFPYVRIPDEKKIF